MQTATGLDRLGQDGFRRIWGRSIGLLCNQASVDHDFEHAIDLLLPAHRQGRLNVQCVFGPEHGLYGHTQDNMIEWEGRPDPRTGLTIHSLYGTHREPTDAMLEGVDLVVVDVPDIGSRYYTYAWSTALCLKACAERGIPMMVLDRPNPIGGLQIEGPVLEPAFSSFVGLHPTPTRHGMTLGELATYVAQRYFPTAQLEVVRVQGWSRGEYLDDTDAPWAMPSPNMPTLDTAIVYPGGCLLEGTNLSEGRGTTRPFEIFGAPFVRGWDLADALNALDLPGVRFRPLQFEPTFNKHAGKVCEGCFVHVTERQGFEPFLTYVAILQEVVRQGGVRSTDHLPKGERFQAASSETSLDGFAWKRPPYEYEHHHHPIDILAGNGWLRPAIENLTPLNEIRQRCLMENAAFAPYRNEALLYAPG